MRRSISIIFLLIIILLSSCTTVGVNLEDPFPASVRKFLNTNGWEVDSYSASIIDNPEEYHEHFRYYILPVSREKLWQTYISGNAGTAFVGDVIEFGLVYSKMEDRIFTADDSQIPAMNVGQIYILNLKVTGFYSIPVAFMISRISTDEHTFEFRYLKENFCSGMQRIRFISGVDRQNSPVTIVEHFSVYKSSNKFRDVFFYPGFHSTTIDDFHRNMASSLGLELQVLDPEEASFLPDELTYPLPEQQGQDSRPFEPLSR